MGASAIVSACPRHLHILVLPPNSHTPITKAKTCLPGPHTPYRPALPFSSPFSCVLCSQIIFSSVQSLSRVWLFETPWIEAHQASLSITNSRSSPKLMSIESVVSYIGFSRGRLGGLVFSSLSEFSTVYCDPHSQRLWHSQESRNRCFSGTPLLFWWFSECWQFDLWFLCLIPICKGY